MRRINSSTRSVLSEICWVNGVFWGHNVAPWGSRPPMLSAFPQLDDGEYGKNWIFEFFISIQPFRLQRLPILSVTNKQTDRQTPWGPGFWKFDHGTVIIRSGVCFQTLYITIFFLIRPAVWELGAKNRQIPEKANLHIGRRMSTKITCKVCWVTFMASRRYCKSLGSPFLYSQYISDYEP